MLHTRNRTPPPSQMMSLTSSVLKSPMATANADYTPLPCQSSQSVHSDPIPTEQLSQSPTHTRYSHGHKPSHYRESSPPSSKPPSIMGKKGDIDELERDGPNEPRSVWDNSDEIPPDAFKTRRVCRQTDKADAVNVVDIKQTREPLPNQSNYNLFDIDQQTQGQRHSVSSLLNLSFDSTPGDFCLPYSQRTLQDPSTPRGPITDPNLQSVSPTQSPIIPVEPIARKAFIQEKAELLRKTLQQAMRNIKPNPQIDRRLSSLQGITRTHDEFESSSEDGPGNSPQTSKPAKSARLSSTPASSAPVNSHDRHNEPKDPELLNPSGSGTRTSSEYRQEPNRSTISSPAMDSSVPPHASENDPAEHIDGDEENSDTISNLSHLQSQMMDRPAHSSVEGMITEARQQPGGVAIDGLRKLMKTTTEYDALDQWNGPPGSNTLHHGRHVGEDMEGSRHPE